MLERLELLRVAESERQLSRSRWCFAPAPRRRCSNSASLSNPARIGHGRRHERRGRHDMSGEAHDHRSLL